MKGFTLNHKNAKKINLESMRDLIYDDATICIENFQILRTEKEEVVNKTTEKEFRPGYDKRVVVFSPGKVDTLPWGFRILISLQTERNPSEKKFSLTHNFSGV